MQQTLNEQIRQIEQHSLLEQINQWEYESINKIKQTAQEIRLSLFNYSNRYINEIKLKLNNLTDQLKESRPRKRFYGKKFR